MSAGIVFHLLATLAYAVLAISLWRPLSKGGSQVTTGKVRRVCLAGAIVLHGIALNQAILPEHSLHLGWALALSAAIWLGMLIFWMENLVMRIDGLLLILLPAATVATLVAAVFPQSHLVAHANSDWLRVHLIIALSAYGLITVAALQAMLMTALDRQLHRPIEQASNRSIIGRALDTMPPLLLRKCCCFA